MSDTLPNGVAHGPHRAGTGSVLGRSVLGRSPIRDPRGGQPPAQGGACDRDGRLSHGSFPEPGGGRD